MKSVLKPLAKSVIIPVGLIVAASATDAAIQKKIFASGLTKLIISNEAMDDIIPRGRQFIDKGCETIKNEAKEQKGGFVSLLLPT